MFPSNLPLLWTHMYWCLTGLQTSSVCWLWTSHTQWPCLLSVEWGKDNRLYYLVEGSAWNEWYLYDTCIKVPAVSLSKSCLALCLWCMVIKLLITYYLLWFHSHCQQSVSTSDHLTWQSLESWLSQHQDCVWVEWKYPTLSLYRMTKF